MSQQFKIVSDNANEKPWYAQGLKFKCTECGQCCSGGPGYAWVTEQEITAIAQHLGLSIEDFERRYVRQVEERKALLEYPQLGNPQNYDCVFLKDKKCQIYSVRPKQCRTFPWWPQNLKSEEDWHEAAQRCEGIGREAPVVPFKTIQEQLNIHQNT